MSKKVAVTISDHDYDQLALLAAMKKIKVVEVVREIVKAHLDGRKL